MYSLWYIKIRKDYYKKHRNIIRKRKINKFKTDVIYILIKLNLIKVLWKNNKNSFNKRWYIRSNPKIITKYTLIIKKDLNYNKWKEIIYLNYEFLKKLYIYLFSNVLIIFSKIICRYIYIYIYLFLSKIIKKCL